MSTLVRERSAEVDTVVVAVPLSLPGFGSVVAELTVAVFDRTVPDAVVALTCVVSVKSALPEASELFEQETVPPEPAAGVVHDQPPGEERETNVVPAGIVSDSDTDDALLGPALLTVMV